MNAPEPAAGAAIPRPAAGEYAPFYAGYVAAVADLDVRRLLADQVPSLRAACEGLSEAEALHRYAPEKWSVKQLLGHLADAERVFAYRLLRVSRGDETSLAGFDENAYVAAGGFDDRSVADLLDDLEAARAATLALVRAMRPDQWGLRGVANGAPVSARALAHVIAGHLEHHRTVLRERYGVG